MIKGMDEDTLKFMSDQIPLGRLGSPEDVADLIYFLSSEEANYITGQTHSYKWWTLYVGYV